MYRNAYNRLSEPDPEPDGGSQAFENRETSGADVHRAENRQGKNCYDTCGALENTFGPAQEKRLAVPWAGSREAQDAAGGFQGPATGLQTLPD